LFFPGNRFIELKRFYHTSFSGVVILTFGNNEKRRNPLGEFLLFDNQ
jgi:hypothetical protein